MPLSNLIKLLECFCFPAILSDCLINCLEMKRKKKISFSTSMSFSTSFFFLFHSFPLASALSLPPPSVLHTHTHFQLLEPPVRIIGKGKLEPESLRGDWETCFESSLLGVRGPPCPWDVDQSTLSWDGRPSPPAVRVPKSHSTGCGERRGRCPGAAGWGCLWALWREERLECLRAEGW